jgi:SagB-type dehydrogenase family enzyme
MNSAFAFLEYHQQSLNRIGTPGLPDGEWPEEWLRIFFKSYPRFEQIALPDPHSESRRTLADILDARESSRDFRHDLPMNMQELSIVLSGLRVTRENNNVLYESRRPYPSAGARYPIEVYVIPFNVQGLEQRVHHYCPRTHNLEKLWSFSPEQIKSCFPNDSWCHESGAAIVMTGCYYRTAIKYHERGYRYCTLDAGHAAQNICLLATNERLASCPYGGYIDEALMRLIDATPSEEIPLHVVFVGKGGIAATKSSS